MRDVLIGLIAGLAAVAALARLSPRPPAATTPAIREVAIPSSVAGELTAPDPRPSNEAHARLQKVIPAVTFDATPLAEVLTHIADVTAANVHVEWRAIEAAGIDRNVPVTLKLHDVPAATILKLALADAGGGVIHLAYRIRDNVVRVSTADDLARLRIMRAFDVRDIIESDVRRSGKTEIDAADDLIRLMREAGDQVTWDGPGTGVQYVAGRLFITATPEDHDSQARLLDSLREPLRPTGAAK